MRRGEEWSIAAERANSPRSSGSRRTAGEGRQEDDGSSRTRVIRIAHTQTQGRQRSSARGVNMLAGRQSRSQDDSSHPCSSCLDRSGVACRAPCSRPGYIPASENLNFRCVLISHGRSMREVPCNALSGRVVGFPPSLARQSDAFHRDLSLNSRYKSSAHKSTTALNTHVDNWRRMQQKGSIVSVCWVNSWGQAETASMLSKHASATFYVMLCYNQASRTLLFILSFDLV